MKVPAAADESTAASDGPATYSEILRASARRWPRHTALNFEEQSWTYAELDELVDRAAAEYQRARVGPGCRVVLLMGNRPEYLIAEFALSRIGASFVTPNPHWTDVELARAIEAAAPTHAIAEDRFASVLDHLVREPLPSMHRPDSPDIPDTCASQPHAEAYLPFSSGTTGLPKAVIHSVGSLVGGVGQIVHHLALTPSDRLQLALPLCHIYGTVMSGAGISAGAELTLFKGLDLDDCLNHLERARVSVLPLAGTTAYELAQRADLEQRDWSSLRFFMWGGSQIPLPLADAITGRTGVRFLCSYGMTEAMCVAFNPVHQPEDWSLVSPGYPSLSTQWRLIGDPGAEEGELEVKGPSVATGYAAAPNDSWQADGWFRTGDIVRVAPDGRCHIVDRKKDLLKVSGFQVSPVEVENTLLDHPCVRECGVFGAPDPRTGELPVAVIVPTQPGLDLEVLRAWSADRLAGYKRPRQYLIATELPRTPSGKLNRAELRARHGLHTTTN